MRSRALRWWAAALAGVAGGVSVVLCWRQPPSGTVPAPGEAGIAVPASSPIPEAGPAAPEPPERIAVPAPVAPPRTFDSYLAELVELGVATSVAHATGDQPKARQHDEAAKALFSEMMERIGDADLRALFTIAAMPEPVTVQDSVRHKVCALAVGTGLQLRQRRAAPPDGDRRDLDLQVAAMLDLLPEHAPLGAALARPLLVDQPHLGAAHEPRVLELLALAGQQRFDGALAGDLLRTLWANLVASGLRTRADIDQLALVLLADSNDSQRSAACRHLLADQRYRDLLLQHLRRLGDRQLGSELAVAAGRDLPVAEALPLIRELRELSTSVQPALMHLALRDLPAVHEHYEQLLADDRDAGMRADLVTGGGFAGAPEAIHLAQLAFDHDPDPGVRMQAAFALTAMAGPARGEQVLSVLLDDPRYRDDPVRLGGLVLALENLARHQFVDPVARLGQRLRLCSRLQGADRERLEGILARCLPSGLR